DRRPFGSGPYLLSVVLRLHADHYPFDIPAVRDVGSMRFDAPVTFLVGENGSGKSTLIEALARVLSFDVQGGTTGTELGARQLARDPLAKELEPEVGPNKPRDSFFLRAESFFN